MFNDFSHLKRIPNLTYRIEGGIQLIEIRAIDKFIILLTIPDNCFEWFISLLDITKENELMADSIDHYESAKEDLTAERQKSIEGFVDQVSNYPLRLKTEKKPDVNSIELLVDGKWKGVTL